MDEKHHLVRNMQEELVELEFCPTDEIIADVLNKLLSQEKFENLHNKMSLVDFVH